MGAYPILGNRLRLVLNQANDVGNLVAEKLESLERLLKRCKALCESTTNSGFRGREKG